MSKLILISLLSFSSICFAGPAKNAKAETPRKPSSNNVYIELAGTIVQSLHGRKGDSVSTTTTIAENTYNVSLSNGAATGSALYAVSFTESGSGEMTIKVTYIDGN